MIDKWEIILIAWLCLGIMGMGFIMGYWIGYDARSNEVQDDTMKHATQVACEFAKGFNAGRRYAGNLMVFRGYITRDQAKEVTHEGGAD